MPDNLFLTTYEHNVEFLGGPNAPFLRQEPEFTTALAGFAFHGYSIGSRQAPHPQKLWHLAPAGSIVHRIETDDPEIKGFAPDAVQAVAFENAQKLTVLLVNPTSKTKNFQWRGLSGQTATPFLTTETQDMAAQPPQKIENGAMMVELPPRSILILETR